MTPGCPWNCPSNENNDITKAGWLSEWALMLRVAPARTLRTLVELGYAGDPAELFVVTREKQNDWEHFQLLRRHVVHAYLFGQSGVGKVRIVPCADV